MTDRISKLLFWLSWPIIYIVVTDTDRTRIMIQKDDSILLVSGWLSDGRWQLPGGGVKRRENFAKAALREMEEEVGIKTALSNLKYLGERQIKDNGLRYICHYFLLKELGSINPKAGHEIKQFKFEKISKINNNTHASEVIEGLKLI